MYRFHTINLIEGKASRRIHVVRGRLTKRQATSRPDLLWPESWRSTSKNHNNEGEKIGQVKDQSLRTPESYEVFISSTQRTRILQRSSRMHDSNWKHKQLRLCLARRAKFRNGETCIQKDEHQSRLTCILEADETKRQRMEGIAPRIHEDHIAGKGDNSLHHYNLVHKFNPTPQAMKNTCSNSSSGQRMGKLEEISTWNLV